MSNGRVCSHRKSETDLEQTTDVIYVCSNDIELASFPAEKSKSSVKVLSANIKSEEGQLVCSVTENEENILDLHPLTAASAVNLEVAAVKNKTCEMNKPRTIVSLINNRYEVLDNINFGGYGFIFTARDTFTGKKVAVKLISSSVASANVYLQHEYEVYNAMKGEFGVPEVYWSGTEFNHEILVMQLLGPSLSQLHKYCNRNFSDEDKSYLRVGNIACSDFYKAMIWRGERILLSYSQIFWITISQIGQQMLHRLQILHSSGFVHRDVKPDNYLMGIGDDEEKCYLIDYGLAQRYISDDEARIHIAFEKERRLIGTTTYASINSHKGYTLSRRDDLESLGYILIEFINRSLPWIREQKTLLRKAKSARKQVFSLVRAMKEGIKWGSVCPKMADWMEYCSKLGFDEKNIVACALQPDYDYLRKIIESISRPSEKSSFNQECDQQGQQTTFPPNLDKSDEETKRYSWIILRESSFNAKHTFERLYSFDNGVIITGKRDKLSRRKKYRQSATKIVYYALEALYIKSDFDKECATYFSVLNFTAMK
ncbi:unnamed protein product [Thelazia callipaeda]|uniref:non-specific serine/threonine protein kinase n=1 Tax=Thelazia callipaeda TaxID=103827 RepID=A0A158RAY4_THECL|nr:unnamed protein product [Thelazia callipaeda]